MKPVSVALVKKPLTNSELFPGRNPATLVMKDLFESARRNSLWFYTPYNNLWFSPDELEAARLKLNAMWDVPTWRLRDPEEYIQEREDAVLVIKKEISVFRERMMGLK